MNFEAFVLIGGRSSRLGRDKSLVMFGGRTLVEKTVDTIRSGLRPERVTLVAADETQYLSAGGFTSGTPFIFDLIKERGPAGGLHAALSYARTPWVFLQACDYPLITAEFLAFLEGRVSGDVDAIVPLQADGRLQPLCAFYKTKPLLEILEDVLNRNRPAPPLYSIVEQANTRIVEYEEFAGLPGAESLFLNINTPADLEHLAIIERKLSDEKII